LDLSSQDPKPSPTFSVISRTPKLGRYQAEISNDRNGHVPTPWTLSHKYNTIALELSGMFGRTGFRQIPSDRYKLCSMTCQVRRKAQRECPLLPQGGTAFGYRQIAFDVARDASICHHSSGICPMRKRYVVGPEIGGDQSLTMTESMTYETWEFDPRKQCSRLQ
jgi:hypothetical protein